MPLPSCSPSPYDILDLPVGATENEVKKQYRKKSLLIHPDKYKHERGLEVCLGNTCATLCCSSLLTLKSPSHLQAFDFLKKVR
jgi:hypothetical protein